MPGRKALPVRFAVLALTVLAVQMPRAADEPSLDQVVKRVAAYVTGYGPQLATIVAEENYKQWVETEPGTIVVPNLGRTRREIRSDFVLSRLGDGDTWVAFRDAFEVDVSLRCSRPAPTRRGARPLPLPTKVRGSTSAPGSSPATSTCPRSSSS
jgi:hypothetical protein